MSSLRLAFTLPKGLIDNQGQIHRQGVIRPATGQDEIFVQESPLVMQNPDYQIFVLLSRVITSLGSLSQLTPDLLERLFLSDYFYLQQLYQLLNQLGGAEFASGELLATPWNNYIKR